MKTLVLILIAVSGTALAQPQPPAAPQVPVAAPPQPTRLGPARPVAPREPGEAVSRPAAPKANYRLRVEIKEGKDAPTEIAVVTSEGRVRLQMPGLKRTVIDDQELPSPMDLTATLQPLEEDKCQVAFFLGRTFPYVTGRNITAGGKGVSQYQQMQLGLETTVILQVGKPLVVQSDPSQQVKITLDKPTE
jgi:hypothetical protein